MFRNLSKKLSAGSDHSSVVHYDFEPEDGIVDGDDEDEDGGQKQRRFVIQQNFAAGLGGTSWRGSVLLAKCLTQSQCLTYLRKLHLEQPHLEQPTSRAQDDDAPTSFTAIELGAGTGLVSLAAAIAPGRFFSSVLATETESEPGVLNLLQTNVSANNNVVAAPVRVSALEWGAMALPAPLFQQLQVPSAFDFVLGSELLYSDELNSLLLATLLALTAAPRKGRYSTVVLSNDTRAGDAAPNFLREASKYFIVERVPEPFLRLAGAGDWCPLQTQEDGVFVLRRRHGVHDFRTQLARFRRA